MNKELSRKTAVHCDGGGRQKSTAAFSPFYAAAGACESGFAEDSSGTLDGIGALSAQCVSDASGRVNRGGLD